MEKRQNAQISRETRMGILLILSIVAKCKLSLPTEHVLGLNTDYPNFNFV